MSNNKAIKYSAKILAIVFAFVLAVSLFAPSATADLSAARFTFVGEDSNVTTNIKLNGKDTGAIYTRIHLGSGGSAGYGSNRIINIVEANPSQCPNLSFEVINSVKYIKDEAPLTDEVAKFDEEGKTILAAVNGDWMSGVNSLGADVSANYRVTFSPLVLDGEIYCSQMIALEQAADYYTMCITKDNKIVIDKPTVSTKIKNVTTGKSVTPTGLNRAPVNNSLNVYNNRLNDSNYVNSDAYEVVIKTDSTNKFYQKQAVTGTVTEIYPAGTVSRCGLTDDIVILTARGTKITNLKNNFSIGDEVSITAEIKCTTNKTAWENCEEAIGGQCRVMKGGKIVNDLSGADMNQYPTNIIGYKSDGTVMMCMVTADTNGKYVGLDFNSNIATFCKEVGYDTCFLFDGGGSTTMVTLDAGKYVERACYSDGHIRNVWNGLALVYNENPNNPPATPTPTIAPTPTPATPTPTKAPTPTPATPTPTKAPTPTPTKTPIKTPTKAPTLEPTKAPIVTPTIIPTEIPTTEPTEIPTEEPTEIPTEEPTEIPTEEPTEIPTTEPTEPPVEEPTEDHAEDQTIAPTEIPADVQTSAPTSNTGSLPTTKTQIMPIVILICVAAVAVVIVIMIIVLKKKK